MADKGQIVLISPMAWKPEGQHIAAGSTHRVGIPLSVLSVATYLDQDGYDVKIVSGAEPDYLEKIIKLISNDTICVGISSMTGYQIAQGSQIAKAIRKTNNSIPIVWGGYHPSILPEQTAQSPYVDYVVRGYGEETLFELVKAIQNGGSFEDTKGITYSDGDRIISTDNRPVKDINRFPFIPYHLVDVASFVTKELGARTIGYISSRGCPNDCSFCADTVVYKRRWKALSAGRVLDDLTILKERYNIDSVRFFDSNFFIDEKRVSAIAKGILDRKLGLKWGRVNGSVEMLTNYKEETWELLRDSGCFSILVGAESGYEKALDRVNKHKNARVKDTEKLSRLTNKWGIRVVYSFMLGIPIELDDHQRQREEFRKELAETLKFINKLIGNGEKLDRVLLFRYTLYPGNSLYDECKNYGWNEPDSLEAWSDNTLWNAKMPWLTDEESAIIDSMSDLVKLVTPALKAQERKSVLSTAKYLVRRLYRLLNPKKNTQHHPNTTSIR